MKCLKKYFAYFTFLIVANLSFAQNYESGEVLIRFKKGVLDSTELERNLQSFDINSSLINDSNLLQDLVRQNGSELRRVVTNLRPHHKTSISRNGTVIEMPDFWNLMLMIVPNSTDISTLSDTLSSYEGIVYASPNYLSTEDNCVGAGCPDDEFVDNQQHLQKISAPQAWYSYSTGSNAAKVGVLDSGIDPFHPDFQYDDNNGNPQSKIVDGYNFKDDNTDFWDYNSNSHGTKVAGIIGAIRNNQIGVAGIAGGDAGNSNYGCDMYALKISNSSSGGNTGVFVNAIVQGVSDSPQGFGFGLHVINNSNSFQESQYSEDLREAVAFANVNGVTFVNSKGNASSDDRRWPVDFENQDWVIGVGAVDDNDVKLISSNYDNGVDITAPGPPNFVYTTRISSYNPPYSYLINTSAAAPQVAGFAALIKDVAIQQNMELHTGDIEGIIQSSANAVSPSQTNYTYNSLGWNEEVGHGRINIERGLKMLHGNWNIQHHSVTGYDNLEAISWANYKKFGKTKDNVLFASYIDSGEYWTQKYRVTKTVNLPITGVIPDFKDDVKVWGRGANESRGWGEQGTSALAPIQQVGYCKLVGRTQTTATFETFVYEIFEEGTGVSLGYYPCAPSNVKFAYTTVAKYSTAKYTITPTLNSNFYCENGLGGTGILIGEAPFVSFINDASVGNPSSWNWNLGSFGSFTGQNPGNKTFTNVGMTGNPITLVVNTSGVQSAPATESDNILSSCGNEPISNIYVAPPRITDITGDAELEFSGDCYADDPSYGWTPVSNTTYDVFSIPGNNVEATAYEWEVAGITKAIKWAKPNSDNKFLFSDLIGSNKSLWNCNDFTLRARKIQDLSTNIPGTNVTEFLTDWEDFGLVEKENCSCPYGWWTGGGGGPVCPHIVLDPDGERVVVNNILPNSINSPLPIVSDFCVIDNDIPTENDNYVLYIEETGSSVTELDYLQLYTVDVPTGFEIGSGNQVDKNFVIYDSNAFEEAESVVSSTQGDIKSLVRNSEDSQFFVSDSGSTLDIVVDSQQASSLKLIIKTIELTTTPPKKFPDAITVVGGGNPIGWLVGRNYDYTHAIDFNGHFNTDSSTTIRITFSKQVAIDQIAVDLSEIEDEGIKINRLLPSLANLEIEERANSINELDNVSIGDSKYSLIKPDRRLKIEFEVPEYTSGYQRKYVLASQGYYWTPGEKTISVEIPKGFSLFSLPVDTVTQDSNYNELFTNGAELFEALSIVNYETVDWSLADTAKFAEGYSINTEYAKSLDFTGYEVFDYDLDIVEGWNLIPSVSHKTEITKYFDMELFTQGYEYDGGYKVLNTDEGVFITPGKTIWVYSNRNETILNFPYGEVSEVLSKATSDTTVTLSVNQLLSLNNLFEFLVTSADSDSVELFLAYEDSLTANNLVFEKPPTPSDTLIDELDFFDAQIQLNDSLFTFANVQNNALINLTLRITASSSKFPVQVSWLDSLGNLQVSVIDSSSLSKPLLTSRTNDELSVKLTDKSQSTIHFSGKFTDSKNPVPLTYSLRQNYPNPFNPTTRIEYSIPENVHVQLEIFNVLGQKVKTLVSEVKQAGNYKVNWSGLNNSGKLVSSGVYFYRLKTDKYVEKKKMIFLK